MKKNLLLFLLILCGGSLCAQVPPMKAEWDFNTLEGWTYCHQDNNPERQCEIKKGKLKIWTRKGSTDRKKMCTNTRIYTTGRYIWRTYVPKMNQGDQVSVGSWLYCDDKHEIDFEVGPGNEHIRKQLNAGKKDMVVYMTTQGNPYHTTPVLIRPGWHIFEIDVTLVNGCYQVEWLIDGKSQNVVQQTYGKEIAFYIYCSVENLKFLGTHPTTCDNYGLFDYVKYSYHE